MNKPFFHKAFIDLVPEAVLLVGLDGCVFETNASFKELTGFDDSFIGQNLLSGHLIKRDSLMGLPALGSDWSGRVDWKKSDGSMLKLFLEWKGLKDSSDRVLGYLVVARSADFDNATFVTRRSVQGQKLESLGMFSGSIAHDLNNLLAGVLGHVSYLRMSLPKEGAHVESISAIEDGARRSASLTKQILEFARGASPELQKLNLTAVVSSAAKIIKGLLPDNVVLNVSPCSEYLVMGEETKLSQIVLNLAVNARDALADGGKISIALENVDIESSEQMLKYGLPKGRYAKLSIGDNGCGISSDVKDKIFEPFFTTKFSRGTGIGLATVLSVVKFHNGSIICESEIGKGTCFEILLPLLEEMPQNKVAKQIQTTAPNKQLRGTERVLVVDDEESVRMIIQRSLVHLGYAVDVASSGIEALTKYRENKGYDLVILDMIMPKMPGEEVFKQLLLMDPKVKVLIASGYSSDGRTRKILDTGGLGYIQKPFAVEELALEVRRCLELKVTK